MYLLGLFAPIQVDVSEFSEVKNPLTPAAAPPTASANQPLVTRRKLSLFGGYGRNPNCSKNQGWIGQRLTLSDFTASKLVSFSNWLDTARSTSLTFGSIFFGWFGWFKTLESDKSSRLLVRRMVEWLSGKTRPCNPQNSEPSPILPEMSGNKPSPTAGWLIIGFTMIYPGCFWVFSLTWACFRWLVICPMEKPPLGNSWRRMHLMYLLALLRQSKLMSPSFLRLKTRWPRLRHHRQHQQASHWWPEENDHYLGGTEEPQLQ